MIVTSTRCCSTTWKTCAFLIVYVASTICRWVFRAPEPTRSTPFTTCSSSRCHMASVPPGGRGARRSCTAPSHTSSPRAHRSPADRWTLMAAWTGFQMGCLKLDGARSQQTADFGCSLAAVFVFRGFIAAFKPPSSLHSCLREPLPLSALAAG